MTSFRRQVHQPERLAQRVAPLASLAMGLEPARDLIARRVQPLDTGRIGLDDAGEESLDAGIGVDAIVFLAQHLAQPPAGERGLDRRLRGKLPVDKLLTSTSGLDEINEGFDALAEGRTIRHVIRM
jgi:threonine dehydrogenase-like Zn-dependent dehydrogenase